MRVRLVKVGVYRGRIDDFIGYIIATTNHYEYDISSCRLVGNPPIRDRS